MALIRLRKNSDRDLLTAWEQLLGQINQRLEKGQLDGGDKATLSKLIPLVKSITDLLSGVQSRRPTPAESDDIFNKSWEAAFTSGVLSDKTFRQKIYDLDLETQNYALQYSEQERIESSNQTPDIFGYPSLESHRLEIEKLSTRRKRFRMFLVGISTLALIMKVPQFIFASIAFALGSRRKVYSRRWFWLGLALTSIAILAALSVPGQTFGPKFINGEYAGENPLMWIMLLGELILGIIFLSSLFFFRDLFRINAIKRKWREFESEYERVLRWCRNGQVIGRPGSSLTNSSFDPTRQELGQLGEQRTAQLLDEVLYVPSARIFHSSAWPGSKNADIDHVVVVGRQVILIDSKQWKAGSYSFHYGNLLRDGEPFQGSALSFVEAVPQFQQALSHTSAEVVGIIVIHASDGTVLTDESVWENFRNTRILVLSADQLVGQILDIIEGNEYTLDLDVLDAVNALSRRLNPSEQAGTYQEKRIDFHPKIVCKCGYKGPMPLVKRKWYGRGFARGLAGGIGGLLFRSNGAAGSAFGGYLGGSIMNDLALKKSLVECPQCLALLT